MTMKSTAERPGLKLGHSMKPRQLTMMGLGSAIGAGLFLGSGAGVQAAGPAVLISYLVAGTLIILVMWALGEMAAANPNSGTGYELEVIAMVVIGGTALTGGRGTIIGTVLGILILRVMRNGIVLIGVPGLAYNIFIGAIILGMMALHSWLERRHQAGT